MVQEKYFRFNLCYNLAMSEIRNGAGGEKEDRNLGGLRFSGERGPLRRIKRRGIGGPGMTGTGLLDFASGQKETPADIATAPQIDVIKKTKERKRRIHPYNIPEGTATWSGPYGKDGTIQVGYVPADVKAYPADKTAHSGAITFTVEVDSPPEYKGQRFKVAKPIKGTGWY